ncbi:MAG TPA: type II toxin-antitoxin system VapB family antitoxin [Candidatus Rubrimentiphilum sp.]|nr:type II toxin-antitoxin system VapB family antitoxin [Candidatus Rubrimentiphilum sp.]
MAINLKDPETEALARELARQTGESLTAAVSQAVRERLERLRVSRSRRAAVERVLKSAWELPRIDSRTPEEIIGYDEHGLPR